MEALDGQMEEYACDYEKLAETCRERKALQQQLDALYARWAASWRKKRRGS